MGHQPLFARRHVRQHCLHLEMGAHDRTYVKELVTVTDVVEASRGQSLGQVRCKQEACEKRKEQMVRVAGQSFTGTTAPPTARQQSVKQWDTIKEEGDNKCSRSQDFTYVWVLQLYKPGVAGHASAKERVADCNGHKMLVKPIVDPGVGHHVRGVCDGATETVQAERSVVEEVADVTGLGGHGAEGVSAAGGEGVQADQKHVDEHRPGVALLQEVQRKAQHAEAPQEVPGRQEVGPDIDRLIGHLKTAENAVEG